MNLAKDKKNFKFSEIFKLLDITNKFEFDKIIFKAFTSGLINCKINEKKELFEIISVKGRDYIIDIQNYKDRINNWIDNLSKTEKFIDDQISSINKKSLDYNENVNKRFKNQII